MLLMELNMSQGRSVLTCPRTHIQSDRQLGRRLMAPTKALSSEDIATSLVFGIRHRGLEKKRVYLCTLQTPCHGKECKETLIEEKLTSNWAHSGSSVLTPGQR